MECEKHEMPPGGGTRRRRLTVVLLAGAAALSLACGSSVVAPPEDGEAVKPAPAGFTPQDEIGIYTAVVRRVCGPDDTFGGELRPPVVFIVGVTDDTAADPRLDEARPRELTEEVRRGVSAALTDLDAEIVWVDAFGDVERDGETGRVSRDGVIVTLGDLHVDDAGRVLVPASIYIANLAAGGTTYVLEKAQGVWTIRGTSGAQWIS